MNPDRDTKESLRSLHNGFCWLLFGVGVYLGAAILFGGELRLSAASWVFVWQVPAAPYVWGIPPLVGGLLGWLSLALKRHTVTVAVCFVCSVWAFILGVMLFASVFVTPMANLLWFPLFWLLSSSYSMLGLSYTERYL